MNQELYKSCILKFQRDYDLKSKEGYANFVDEIKKLKDIWKTSVDNRIKNPLDEEFWEIYDYFKLVDDKVIYEKVLNYFWSLPETYQQEFLSIPTRYTFLTGKIDVIEQDFSLINQYVKMMSREIEKYKWLYEMLADYRSQRILNGIIKYWFQFNIDELHRYTENVFLDYFDLDILQCGKEDIFVDLGAYTGDSITDYITTYGNYKKIYAYEITPGTYQKLINNLNIYSDIVFNQKGVGKSHGSMYIDVKINDAGNKVSDNGINKVEVVCLDEDILEPISVVKMDIEGAEKEAIEGMKKHIQNEKPKLLISTYHIPADIFEIPYMLFKIRNDYKFYLRFNGRGIWPCDYILFAV